MRILVLPYTHMLSHVSRPLLVAKGLRDRGCEVIFAGESEKKKFIESEGFTVLPLYEPDPSLLLDNIRKGRLKFTSDAEIEAMIEADIALYEEVKPDIVLSDFRLSAPISTQLSGLKHVAIVNASSTEYRSLPYAPLFDWIPGDSSREYTGFRKPLNSFNLGFEMFVFDNAMSIFKKLSKQHRLRKTVTATNCLAGVDMTLLADIPEYFPTHDLPDNYHYIGPLTWQTDMPSPSWWPPKRSGGPLVYITMGTTGIEEFFGVVADLIRQSDMTAIISTGAQISGLKSIDGHIYIEPFVDGDLVMEACDVVVCHGGNGTIYQAIQQGKPVIGIPTIADQQFNMRMVERLGIGKSITWKMVLKHPQALLDLIHATIEDQSIHENVVRLGKTLGTYKASQTATDLIMGSGRL